jgi:hypothetical protein
VRLDAALFPAMPSRAAHRTALRRFKEPSVVAPSGLDKLPALSSQMGWRNPVRDYDYVRSEWQIYIVLAHASVSLAQVNEVRASTFEVRSGSALAHFRDPFAAFELAAKWAEVACRRLNSCAGYGKRIE